MSIQPPSKTCRRDFDELFDPIQLGAIRAPNHILMAPLTRGRNTRNYVATPSTKRDLIIGLLGRLEGASLDEIIMATGWLPHTTRAALSRLRSAGQTLAKSSREDGCTAYRIVGDEPKPMTRVILGPEHAKTAQRRWQLQCDLIGSKPIWHGSPRSIRQA